MKENSKKTAKKNTALPEKPVANLALMIIEFCTNYLNEKSVLNIGVDTCFQELKEKGLKTHVMNDVSSLHKLGKPPISESLNSFDLVLVIHVLQKVKNLPQLIAEISKLLKSGGVFVFTYEKSLNKYNVEGNTYFHFRDNNGNTTYIYYDGYLQSLLLENGFFIQYEQEYFISREDNIESVLIIAEKK